VKRIIFYCFTIFGFGANGLVKEFATEDRRRTLWMILVWCSVAQQVDVFDRNCLFVCVYACLFVHEHDNFRMIKHRMMKLGGRCIVQSVVGRGFGGCGCQ